MPPRTRASARAAGSWMERMTADYLRDHVSEFVDRRVKKGAKDCGDLGGVRSPHGGRVVVEVKNVRGNGLGTWMAEAEAERINDEADVAVVIAKRHGRGAPGDQWVHMTLRDFATLLSGQRPQE